jgi:hypothetical protein
MAYSLTTFGGFSSIFARAHPVAAGAFFIQHKKEHAERKFLFRASAMREFMNDACKVNRPAPQQSVYHFLHINNRAVR